MSDDEEEGGEEGAPPWMATFADLMSLLLTFFVLLLSFSTMDVLKFQGMVGSLRDAFGVQRQRPGIVIGMTEDLIQLSEHEKQDQGRMEALVSELRRAAAERGYKDGVEVSIGQDGVRMRVPGDLLFESGESAVSPRAFAFLDDIAQQTRVGGWQLGVEGHADAAGSSAKGREANWRLASERGLSTLLYLKDAGRVRPERLSSTTYGDSHPVASNDTAEGRRANRRVELLFTPVEQQTR